MYQVNICCCLQFFIFNIVFNEIVNIDINKNSFKICTCTWQSQLCCLLVDLVLLIIVIDESFFSTIENAWFTLKLYFLKFNIQSRIWIIYYSLWHNSSFKKCMTIFIKETVCKSYSDYLHGYHTTENTCGLSLINYFKSWQPSTLTIRIIGLIFKLVTIRII